MAQEIAVEVFATSMLAIVALAAQAAFTEFSIRYARDAGILNHVVEWLRTYGLRLRSCQSCGRFHRSEDHQSHREPQLRPWKVSERGKHRVEFPKSPETTCWTKVAAFA
jgi:hypothetical protein